MEPTTPPNPMPEHQLGYEILTKHKEAIRQLRWLANWGPDLNPIEKCWRAMKQALQRRKIQPTNEKEMANAMIEEWDALDQERINGLIAEQRHWIFEVVACRGWMTAN
jgi:transposase